MNYSQILSYLYSQLPMYQRIGPQAYKSDLNNTIEICQLLGNPESKFNSVHVAGTNGKGSVSHMLAAVLQSAGYKTGLYTSPHLKDFRERIRINGKMISKNYVIQFVRKYKSEFEKIKPSFFEWSVGLAFDYFANKRVDVAIIETGLGGRLDSTNVINPILSIITNISYDHQHLLGNTLHQIASEKAGIIKKNGIVIVSERQKEVEKIFRTKAKKENALLLFAEDWIKSTYKLKCGLKGFYQKKNIRSVILAAVLLSERFNITEKAILKGIKEVTRLTGLKGRWEILSKKPLMVADVAHNEAGIKEVFMQVKNTPYKNLHVVFGVSNDKDLNRIFPLFPKNAIYYFCKANIPRAMDENILSEQASKHGLIGKTFPSVQKAIKAAKKNALQSDLILITGSAFVVAEAI